eukprot:1134390-Pelagomonas_calceolata.AAC.1
MREVIRSLPALLGTINLRSRLSLPCMCDKERRAKVAILYMEENSQGHTPNAHASKVMSLLGLH